MDDEIVMKRTRVTAPKLKKSYSVAVRQKSELFDDVKDLISRARQATAAAVNAALVFLYWQIGNRIHTEFLGSRRAKYGEEILPTLSAELVPEYGRGFSERNLWRMLKFAQLFPDPKILPTLSAELGWSHFIELLSVKDKLKREFYTEMCRIERWSVRTLQAKISGMLFERTALSKKPTKLISRELKALKKSGKLSPDLVFRDPYFLDFLGLKDTYSEKDLEGAILAQLQQFLLELGKGFAFVARQKRIVIDGKDYYIDLLFYHRGLRRLVAIELKLGTFQAADKGQMELYLRWLEKYEMSSDEDPPLGLILCEDKGSEQIELLQLHQSGIRISSYLTELLPKKALLKKLREAVRLARREIE